MIGLDIAVGVTFLLAALTFRRTPAHAALLAATGLLWFAGDFVGVLVFAHRAPLTHFLLLYPDTRLRSWLKRSVVLGAYVASFVYPIGQLTVVTAALFVAVLIAGVVGTPRVPSASLRSARIATAGAALLWGLLTAAGVARLAGAGIDAFMLIAYQIALVAILTVIAIDNRYRLSRTAIVTSLAVDLGEGGVRPLRDVLAEVLGDPSVVVGLVSDDGFTDEAGRPMALNPTSSQVVTDLFEGNQRIAMLQHDAALLRDKELLDSVTALAAVALANARLQHEIRSRIAVVEASRRRLLAVADDERDRLEAQLRDSVLTRLAHVEALLGRFGSADLCGQLESTRDTIRAFARGVYPRRLEELGLAVFREMTLPVDHVEVTVPEERFRPDVEAAAYFLGVEAMTNIAKYAQATATRVSIEVANQTLAVEVADNGIGGADPAKGTGLRGLQDRLDVLGGVLALESSGRGTRVRGVIPLDSSEILRGAVGPLLESRLTDSGSGLS
jgi:signal transduction histidine kinase